MERRRLNKKSLRQLERTRLAIARDTSIIQDMLVNVKTENEKVLWKAVADVYKVQTNRNHPEITGIIEGEVSNGR